MLKKVKPLKTWLCVAVFKRILRENPVDLPEIDVVCWVYGCDYAIHSSYDTMNHIASLGNL